MAGCADCILVLQLWLNFMDLKKILFIVDPCISKFNFIWGSVQAEPLVYCVFRNKFFLPIKWMDIKCQEQSTTAVLGSDCTSLAIITLLPSL